jgi:hypothetical protein
MGESRSARGGFRGVGEGYRGGLGLDGFVPKSVPEEFAEDIPE